MTSEEFQNAIRNWIDGVQLPSALCVLAQKLKQSKDPAANNAAQMAMSAVVAAETDNAKLLKILTDAGDYFESVAEAAAHVGTFNETFSGAANQELTETITGDWITTDTVVVVQTTESPASAYYGSFTMNSETPVAGSFVIRTKNVGAAPAGTYGFKWVAANPT